MNRSLSIIVGLSLCAAPALAQQPMGDPQQGYQQPASPAPGAPAAPPQYGQPAPPPQYDPSQAPPVADPYAQAADDDEDDDGYDVTYDVSVDDDGYDDGYDPNAYQQFESTLDPYGTWEDVPTYGHVWIPSTSVVGYDFEPYASGGHWVMSDYGWTWVSDWDWGWAPFHYGRWMVVGGYGWCWVPGTVWGPAWVSWRWGGGYVGWAPMAPRGVVIGPPRGRRSPWRFTVAAQLGAARPHYMPSRVLPSVWARTSFVRNTARINVGNRAVRINAGPPASAVAATLGRPVRAVALRTAAPRALPRPTIAARVGMPVQNRPWVRSRPIGGAWAHPAAGARTLGTFSRPAPYAARPLPLRPAAPGRTLRGGGSLYVAPSYRAPAAQAYRAPAYRAPQAVRPNPYYRAPAYRAPQAFRPAPVYRAAPQPYRMGAPAYRAPAYHAPVYAQPAYRSPSFGASQHFAAPQRFSAPSYHFSAPQQHFSAPSYHAPAHMSAPSFHGGGFGGARGSFHR